MSGAVDRTNERTDRKRLTFLINTHFGQVTYALDSDGFKPERQRSLIDGQADG